MIITLDFDVDIYVEFRCLSVPSKFGLEYSWTIDLEKSFNNGFYIFLTVRIFEIVFNFDFWKCLEFAIQILSTNILNFPLNSEFRIS